MKIVAFSDTHRQHDNVSLPLSVVGVFAGDAMGMGYKKGELIPFLEWYSEQPIAHRIMIAGNHDRFIENNAEEFKSRIKHYPIIYLEDSGIEIEGVKFYGTPHTRVFHNWAFNRSSRELEKAFKAIPSDTDVLITHGPAYGILDQAYPGNGSLGEKELLEVIPGLKNLQAHIFGHIHGGYGELDMGEYIAYNCSICNESYEPVNKPWEIEV